MAGLRKPFSLYKRKRKHGKPIYYVRFLLPDGQRSAGRPTGETAKGKAEAWAYAELKKGATVARVNVTLAEYSAGFFLWDSPWAVSKRSTGKRLSRGTCIEKQTALETRVLPYLGARRLSSIDKKALEFLRNELFKRGLAGDSINKALSCVLAVLQAAEDDHLLGAVPRVERAAKNCKERGILDPDEMRRLFNLPWSDERAFISNLLAALSGLRMGELLALQHKSIRPGYLDILKGWNQQYRALNDSTKTGRSRYVVIPGKIETLLRGLIAASPWGTHPENFIFFSTTSAAYPMDGKRALDGLKDALQKIGIDEKTRRARFLDFHSWRHWFNSILINSKVPLHKVMAMTGHITPEMAENYYHADDLGDVRQIQESILGGLDHE